VIQETCPHCQKRPDLCVCSDIKPLPTKLEVLILQHPQEPDKLLGSATLAHLALKNSQLKVGLSWPNLKKVLGREAQPSRWAVLYLGSGLKEQPPKQQAAAPTLYFVDKKGGPQKAELTSLEGLIVLDGTWSQAKTLWWRNAWLLKCRRVILQSSRASLYRELRKEPRRECLSTVESIAESLDALGESPEVSRQLRMIFESLLNKQRARLRARREPQPPKSTPA
jgi:DTW domain-containing protein YfiP